MCATPITFVLCVGAVAVIARSATATVLTTRRPSFAPADATSTASALDAGVDGLVSMARRGTAITGAMLASTVLWGSAVANNASPEPPCKPQRETPVVQQQTSSGSAGAHIASEMPDPKTIDSTKVVTEDKEPCNPAARRGGRR
jgi:hypothetical protein